MYYSKFIQKSDAVDDIKASNRAVVAGGTQGIGAGIALRFALAGASVWVIGRSEERGKEIVKKLEQASLEGARRRQRAADGDKPEFDFLRADLSDVEEIKRVAEVVKQKAGSRGIDWLFETQGRCMSIALVGPLSNIPSLSGGPPTGNAPDTPKGIDSQFAVQILSRFGLANALLEAGTIKRALCVVAAPGGGSSEPLELDDIELKQARKTWSMAGPLKIVKTGQRDSSVADAFLQDFAERYPTVSISHLFPNIVGTNSAANSGFPFPIPQLFNLASFALPSPEQYSAVPFYLHASPEGNRYLRSGEANLFSPSLKRYEISKNVATKEARQAVVAKLKSYGF